MSHIINRLILFVGAVLFCFGGIVLICITYLSVFYSFINYFLIFATIIECIFLYCLAVSMKDYHSARLIIENKITVFQYTITESNFYFDRLMHVHRSSDLSAIISCFGILIGSQVVLFNADKIWLTEIQIGTSDICFTYGKNGKYRKTRILHDPIDATGLYDMAGKLKYETGVTPIIVCES